MEIQALRLIITEDDLNALVQEHLPADSPVENLHIRLAPEGTATPTKPACAGWRE